LGRLERERWQGHPRSLILIKIVFQKSTPENQLNRPEDFAVLPYSIRRLTYQFRLRKVWKLYIDNICRLPWICGSCFAHEAFEQWTLHFVIV